MLESKIQKECNNWLSENDICHFHKEKGRNHKQTTHSKGLPDLLIWNKGKACFIELKTATGKFSDDQEDYNVKVWKAGFIHYIARSKERMIEILEKEGMV